VLPPCVTVAEAGVAESAKSGAVVQEVNLKFPMRVLQLKLPLFFKYSVVYHMVQSSTGSTLILL